MIKTTGRYEIGGNKTSCRSDVRKHGEMGGRKQVEKKRVDGGIVSVPLREVGKVNKSNISGEFYGNSRYKYHTHQAQVTQQGCGWVPWTSLDLRNIEKFVAGRRRGEQGEQGDHQNHRTEAFSRFFLGYHHQEDRSTSKGRDCMDRRQRDHEDACL